MVFASKTDTVLRRLVQLEKCFSTHLLWHYVGGGGAIERNETKRTVRTQVERGQVDDTFLLFLFSCGILGCTVHHRLLGGLYIIGCWGAVHHGLFFWRGGYDSHLSDTNPTPSSLFKLDSA